jgi:hypothetical protein
MLFFCLTNGLSSLAKASFSSFGLTTIQPLKKPIKQQTTMCFFGKIWRFPEMGVALNHQLNRMFHYINQPFWGSPICGNTHVLIGFQTS